MKTPGSTAIRRPQKPAQPTTCSRGSPDARRSTMAVSSAGVPAAEMSTSASSSANTQPADRSLVTMADRETGEGVTGMGAPGGPVSAGPGRAGRTCRASARHLGAGHARAPGPRP